MGAIRMRIQTADKSVVFVINKSIKTFFNFSPQSIILISSVTRLSGEKYANIKHDLQVKTVLNKYVGGFR